LEGELLLSLRPHVIPANRGFLPYNDGALKDMKGDDDRVKMEGCSAAIVFVMSVWVNREPWVLLLNGEQSILQEASGSGLRIMVQVLAWQMSHHG
jgi:hypothetical protein